MANGAKFSQIGIDVDRASDYELHFDSEWPTVHVMAGGITSATVKSPGRSLFYHHGLGYIPAFLPYVYDATAGSFEIFRVIMSADKENIYWYAPNGSGMPSVGTVTYGLMIFNIDIEQNYVAPQDNPSTNISGDQGTPSGIIVAKDGADIGSKDMQDFLMNTNARAPLIHAVSTGLADKVGSNPIYRNYEYTHDLPYNPMFLPYVQSTLTGGNEYVFIANFAGINTVGNKIQITALSPGSKAAIVVLKDPFDVSDNTQVVSI